MPSQRPNLILDEQAFQELLSAAFTIQEHNDWLKRVRQTPAESEASSEARTQIVCEHCGAPKPVAESRCQNCGLEQFRPGERLQRNWASMWLMSQEQGLWPGRSPEAGEAAGTLRNSPTTLPHFGGESTREKDGFNPSAAESEWTTTSADFAAEDLAAEDQEAEDSELPIPTFQLAARDNSSRDEATDEAQVVETKIRDARMVDAHVIDASQTELAISAAMDSGSAGRSSLLQRFSELRVTLRFHRADVYLGAAVVVAAFALLWPAAGSPRRSALGPWERALVSLGIAEAPTPEVHLQGDPGISVWVDPHTAIYYCPGEEQYGKTADGRVSSQREAQMERFEPAGRAPCE